MSVGIGVVDSGVNVPHPHLPTVAGGLTFDLQGGEREDFVDRLGHGTAVTAAIHEKAPTAEIFALKVFDDQLATSVKTLVRAIDWASERGLVLVNLSLGTPNDFRADELRPAVDRAIERGTVIVSAREDQGQLWYPGCMPGVVGVLLDWEHPRETISAVELSDGAIAVRASGFPRPIPGVPPKRNLNGISFAVANTTGALAAHLAERPYPGTAEELLRSIG